MPVDGKDLGADFVIGSGHKSMASAAPSGVLATTEEWAPVVFRTTQMKGDLTERRFGIKEVEMLGLHPDGRDSFLNDGIISGCKRTGKELGRGSRANPIT